VRVIMAWRGVAWQVSSGPLDATVAKHMELLHPAVVELAELEFRAQNTWLSLRHRYGGEMRSHEPNPARPRGLTRSPWSSLRRGWEAASLVGWEVKHHSKEQVEFFFADDDRRSAYPHQLIHSSMSHFCASVLLKYTVTHYPHIWLLDLALLREALEEVEGLPLEPMVLALLCSPWASREARMLRAPLVRLPQPSRSLG
jgi:hypothetical protein